MRRCLRLVRGDLLLQLRDAAPLHRDRLLVALAPGRERGRLCRNEGLGHRLIHAGRKAAGKFGDGAILHLGS